MGQSHTKELTPEEQERLSTLKSDGIIMTDRDLQKALKNNPEKLFNIGFQYYSKQQYTKAIPWYRKAAAHGHARSMGDLGWMYQYGLGVTADYAMAVEWFRKGASKADAHCQNNLGYMYIKGLGVETDYKLAMKWLKLAYKSGDEGAPANIGFLYQNGWGVTKNIKSSIKWFKKSANKGKGVAQFHLGKIYETEETVRNLSLAKDWYGKAVESGYEGAAEALENISKQLVEQGEQGEKVGKVGKEEKGKEGEKSEANEKDVKEKNDKQGEKGGKDTKDVKSEKNKQDQTPTESVNKEKLYEEEISRLQEELKILWASLNILEDEIKIKVEINDNLRTIIEYFLADESLAKLQLRR